MISKKDALTLGILAVGGIAVASAFSKADGEFESSAPGAVRGGGAGIFKDKDYAVPEIPIIYQIAAQPEVRFPEPPDYTEFIREFLAPQPREYRSSPSTPSPKKESVIYGGYTPSGKTYVFGGPAFEAQSAKEVSELGYSPTLAASFGIKPEIAAGGGGTSKKRSSSGRSSGSRSSAQRSADKKRSRERRASSPEGGGF